MASGVAALRLRIVDATLSCLARHGTAKTTVEDVARRAGVSRATVYRAFPGGRDEVLRAVVETETERLFAAVGSAVAAATDLDEALVAGIVEASRRIRDHATLGYLVAHEPGTILGHLAFDEADQVLANASLRVAPFLTRWMSPLEAARVAEWAAPDRPHLCDLAACRHRSHRPRPDRTSGRDVRDARHPRAQRPRPDRHPRSRRENCMTTETTEMRPTADIIGRDDINDLEAILSVVNTDEADEAPRVSTPTTTPSSRGTTRRAQRPKLDKLYEKAKTAQWNGADRPALGDRGRPGAPGDRQRRGQRRLRRRAST